MSSPLIPDGPRDKEQKGFGKVVLVSRDAQNLNSSPVGPGLLSPPSLPPGPEGLFVTELRGEGTPGKRDGTGEAEKQVSGSGFELCEAWSRRSWRSSQPGSRPSPPVTPLTQLPAHRNSDPSCQSKCIPPLVLVTPGTRFRSPIRQRRKQRFSEEAAFGSRMQHPALRLSLSCDTQQSLVKDQGQELLRRISLPRTCQSHQAARQQMGKSFS